MPGNREVVAHLISVSRQREMVASVLVFYFELYAICSVNQETPGAVRCRISV